MANKQKKKRNKKYHGSDAKVQTPQILRVSAEERSAFKEWWLTYGRLVKVAGGLIGVIIVLVILFIGIFGIIQR